MDKNDTYESIHKIEIQSLDAKTKILFHAAIQDTKPPLYCPAVVLIYYIPNLPKQVSIAKHIVKDILVFFKIHIFHFNAIDTVLFVTLVTS